MLDAYAKLENTQIDSIDKQHSNIKKKVDSYSEKQAQLERSLHTFFDNHLGAIRYFF